MRAIPLIALTSVISSCGQAQEGQTANATEAETPPSAAPAELYESPQGAAYAIERASGFDLDQLPMNSDLKMADRDLAKYAETLCVLDVPPATAPKRCDIYVQPDPGGTLIGYATVTQDAKGVSFQTTTTTNERRQPGGGACYVGGRLAGSGADWKNPIYDASKNFSGQFAYMAWEKDPGNWMVSPMDGEERGGPPENASAGVWYVEKKGEKLRINQERWNYCYRDTSVVVDDVFYRAITLIRK